MRILIDECVDERLRNALSGHECRTARFAGMAGMKNGEILKAAEDAGFDVLLTVDQGFSFEQNLQDRRIAVLVFRVRSNRLRELLRLVPDALKRLESIQPGEMVNIG